MRGEKGFALVLTLVVTALMVAVAAEMIHQVYVDTTLSRSFRDGQQASLLAESGVTSGVKLLQVALASQNYTSLSDSWAAPFKLDDEVGSIEISASEESGKINLNGLVQANGDYEPFTQAALKRLGQRLQIPEDCWSSLADWLDSNDLPRAGGAESAYYSNLKPPYNAHNGPLATLNELTLVRGFTPEMVTKLMPFVTIYTDTSLMVPKININTASREVIQALDDRIDDRMVERILEKRRLQPFKLASDLTNLDSQLGELATKHIIFKGNIFRVISVARVKDTARTVEAVVRMTDTPPSILSWREY